MTWRIAALLVLLPLALLQGCATPRQWLLGGVADALAAPADEGEDDLLLARDAAAFHLKLSESLLRELPAHTDLAAATAAGFTQYAYAFVAFEADRLEATDARAAQRARARAARLYERAHRHAMGAPTRVAPTLREDLAQGRTPALRPADVELAYWAAASWAAAISLSTDRPDAVADLPQAVRLAQAAHAVSPAHGHGALASLMGTLEAARPGGRADRARDYFAQALEAAGPRAAPVHLARAEALDLPAGDRAAFEQGLRLTLSAAQGRQDLASRVMAERAAWLLSRLDDLF